MKNGRFTAARFLLPKIRADRATRLPHRQMDERNVVERKRRIYPPCPALGSRLGNSPVRARAVGRSVEAVDKDIDLKRRARRVAVLIEVADAFFLQDLIIQDEVSGVASSRSAQDRMRRVGHDLGTP